MSIDIDFYELLEIERTADANEIKTAYRKLAMKYHPDRNPGCQDSESRFKAVSEAYECLKDPQKRAAYDRFGHAAFRQGGAGGGAAGGGFGGADFGDFSDIFDTIFGNGFGGGGGRGAQRRGADLRHDIEIGLEEAYHGLKTSVTIEVAATCEACDGTGAEPGTSVETCPTCAGHGKVRAQQGFFVVERTCPSCHGAGQRIKSPCRACRGEGRIDQRRTLEIDVPAGVDEGTRLRLVGKGEAGPRGAPAGDLYIFIHIRRHAIFERDGGNLFCRVPISFTLAALGGEIRVPGLDGVEHEIKIPVGIQSGRQLRQRGAGMPVINSRSKGDLVMQIDVETPTRLTARQRELLEAFRDTETGEEHPHSTGFFAKLKDMWEGLTERP
jgi:molecular chaperone DnaJ